VAKRVVTDGELVVWKRLPTYDVAQVERKMFERRQCAGLHVEMSEIETPAAALTAAMLAHEAIEPALETAPQPEIFPIDRQDLSFVENASVEPIRQDQFDAERPAVRIGCFLPFVDPGEAVAPLLSWLADGCGDAG
jgi:hypothetical protein